ncbi:MAG TPA: hypothetical protein VL737_03830 [Candidatus Pristimantibacillus sp.]|nr:hypothetical protein [Candidatus Pristimantibacillus sp.]
MTKRAGVFIVIEGSDGSGKTTQLELIQQRLEASGHQVETFDFPRYSEPSSYFVKRYLKGDYGSTNEVGPYTSSLFYALDRFEAAPQIREALEQGKIVLCNRFTGSNMAHQGTKIANAEQRRGFFIWLDNLEFEMLRIPRPDISFVLRVPADISEKLMAERQKDIHESDRQHLERAVMVYDEMTQLFPKDFQRIDCVRSGQLLGVDTINTMLWEKVSPLLPPPAQIAATPAKVPEAIAKPVAEARAQVAAAIEETVRPAAEQPADTHLTLENASNLLLQRIQSIIPDVHVDYPDVPAIYTPANLVPDAQKEFEAGASTLLGLYAKIIAGLAKRGVPADQARQTAALALPVALAATIRLHVTEPRLEELIVHLVNDTLPEAQTAGANLFAQAIKAGTKHFTQANQPVKRAAPTAVKALADEFLSQNHIGEQPAVQLIVVWPRNELDLVADMLYEHTNLPLRTIQERIADWAMGRKLAVFEAYVGDAEPGRALEKAHYTWDLLSPFSTFCVLQQQQAEALELQPLTPRFGFDVPQLVDEADLGDTFEKCFDLSLKLFSTLQQAGHQIEAQYATLFGHNQRWKMTQNAVQAIRLQRGAEAYDSETRKLLAQMAERLTEAHPILAETATAANPAAK